jgi:hypothetical protein
VSRFNVSTGQRTNDYVLGSGIYSDFHVLPVPEPATSILLLVGLMLLATRHRVC